MYVCFFSKTRAKLVYVSINKFIITIQVFVRLKKDNILSLVKLNQKPTLSLPSVANEGLTLLLTFPVGVDFQFPSASDFQLLFPSASERCFPVGVDFQFAPLCGVAATSVATLKPPVAPREGGLVTINYSSLISN